MPGGSPLLKVVLHAERIVGSRLESAVHSDTYFDLLTQANRGKARLTGAVEAVSKHLLHFANLPAGTDIRRVREQLSRMERRLIEVSKDLEELSRQREPQRTDAGSEAISEHGRA